MHNTQEKLASANELTELHSQLEKLITHNEHILKELDADADADLVMKWIERCEKGSARAEYKLYHEGLTILENIKSKLHLALEEQQHMEEESATAANTSRGRETERYAKASKNVNNAVSALEHMTGNEKH